MRSPPKPGLRRSVLLLASGTILGQGALVAASPLLTRFYGREEFAAFAFYTSVANTVAAFGALRLDAALVVPGSQARARWLLLSSSVAAAVCALAIGAIGFLLIGRQFGGLGDWSWRWLPLAGTCGLLLILTNALTLAASRLGRAPVVAAARGTTGVTQALSQVLFGSMAPGLGLVAGDLLGRIMGFVTLYRARVLGQRPFLFRRPFAGVQAALRTYRDFALHGSLGTVWNVLSLQLPTILIGAAFGRQALGSFALAFRLGVAPIGVLGVAIGQSIVRDGALPRDPEEQDARLTTVASMLLALCLPLASAFVVASRSYFELAFGPGWGQAADYSAVMTPWFVLWLPSSAVSIVLLQRRELKASSQITLVEFLLRAGGLGVGALLRSDSLAIGLFAAAGIVSSIMLFVRLRIAMSVVHRFRSRSGSFVLLGSAMVATLPTALKTWGLNIPLSLVLTAVLAILVAGCGAFLMAALPIGGQAVRHA